MPRGAKRDREATQLARKAKRITDRRSFVSTKGELRLYGADMGRMREAVYERDGGRCAECGILTVADAPLWMEGRAELDHILPRGRGGSDDPENLRILCARHHRGPHGKHA